jgi:SAM-dependent methyltransferase
MLTCRSCAEPLRQSFVDLGMQPLSNAYIDPERGDAMEPFYPLHARVCTACFLVQLPEVASPAQIFTEYAYLSSMSTTWLDHCRELARDMSERLQLGTSDLVLEIASNDGALLGCFKDRGVRVLGVEPARNIAAIANRAGVETISVFFGADTARHLLADRGAARLIVANNVLAHVPDLNGFTSGLRIALAPDGVLSVEFPHVLQLIEHNQFDTIYHEHFSYLSLLAVERVFQRHGLRVFDVVALPTHGGSLRLLACRDDHAGMPATERVVRMRDTERAAGLARVETYKAFALRVHETKRKLLELLIREKRAGRTIVGYGAPAKGNTLLNYCGIREDFLDFTVDRNPLKQGKLLPGTRIPIRSPDEIARVRPDLVLILPWNLEREILEKLAFIREWGGRCVVPIPEARVV